MPSVVEIIIKAVNEAGEGITGATKELDKMEDQVESTKKKQEEFAKSAALAGTILVGLGAAVNDIVSTYTDYADQVRDLNQLTGAQAEEASKMIQVADDAQVSYDQLSGSLEFAVRKGIDPSVKSLAELSDQYLALAPGLDRSAFLMETFGRSGMNMANIMEMGSAAIYEQSNQVNAKLVLDDKAIEKSVELAAAQDDLEDSLLAVKLALGEYLVPLLKQAADGFLLVLNYNDKLKTAFEKHSDEVVTTSNSYAEYKAEIERTAKASNMYIDAQGNLRDGQGRIWEMNYLLTESEYAVGKAVLESVDAIAKENAEVAKRKDSTITLTTNYVTNSVGGILNQNTDIEKRAAGGSVSSNTPYIVGEEGPELFVPGASGNIVPNGAGGNITIVYSPMLSTASQAELERVLVPIIRKAGRKL